MSGVAILRFLNANDAGITAAVPAERIFSSFIPLKTLAPALGFHKVSGTERLTVSMAGAKKLRSERVQIDITAASQPAKGALVELVRAACANRHGIVNGFDLDSILPLGEGPDDDDPVAFLYSTSLDYLVKWRSS